MNNLVFFHADQSTPLQLLSFYRNIIKSTYRNFTADVAYIDFANVFDTVLYILLLIKSRLMEYLVMSYTGFNHTLPLEHSI